MSALLKDRPFVRQSPFFKDSALVVQPSFTNSLFQHGFGLDGYFLADLLSDDGADLRVLRATDVSSDRMANLSKKSKALKTLSIFGYPALPCTTTSCMGLRQL